MENVKPRQEFTFEHPPSGERITFESHIEYVEGEWGVV